MMVVMMVMMATMMMTMKEKKIGLWQDAEE